MGENILRDNFDNYCQNEGISRQLSYPYIPQENGVAERMNCTLANMIRCVLFDAHLDASFLGEAVMYAAEILNCLPTRVYPEKTLEERFVWKETRRFHLSNFWMQSICACPG